MMAPIHKENSAGIPCSPGAKGQGAAVGVTFPGRSLGLRFSPLKSSDEQGPAEGKLELRRGSERGGVQGPRTVGRHQEVR